MLDQYKTVLEGGTGEITEKKSRFIATVRPVSSEEEALAFLEETRKKYWDARHNCYAYSVGMNREYCTKLFKKSTGYNLKEYIVNEKMKAAKTLLSTTELPITLISSHVGYGNYSNFTRSFKQITGMTPLEYRKQK